MLLQSGISYTVKKNPRAKGLRVSVYQDGSCVVSAPPFIPHFAIQAFISLRSSWIKDKINSFMPFRPMPPSKALRRKNSRLEYIQYKEAARELVTRRLPELNKAYGFTLGKIAIRNQKSRWGSCSTRGNLNFNYKIALLPQHLADYLMVHEICHVGEFNHSQQFWNLVAQTVPDYKNARAELKKYGLTLG